MRIMRTMVIAAALMGLPSLGQGQPYPSGGWSGPYMDPMFPPGPEYGPAYGRRDPREGKIEAAAFVTSGPNVSRLGHGAVVLAPGAEGPGGAVDLAVFESALVDQLAKAGYRTDAQPQSGGQTVEFVVHHDVVAPPELPHSPVGGAVSAGVGSHGWGGVGMALDIDLSKPLKALIATRLEARISDSATHELLWQGRAQVVAREGDKRWTPEATAAKLAAALFKGFPKPS